MPKINSLYDLIKQKSQGKNRPLKVICDWDDCIQPLWPWIVFENSPDKDNLNKFPEYFAAYFNENTATNQEAVEFVKKAKKEKLLEEYYKKSAETYGTKERFNKTPFTTVAEDLLKGLKENLIDKLMIITSFSYEGEKDKTALWTCSSNNGKFEKFSKTFGQFPGSFFELTELKKNEEGKYVPRRWQRIEQLFSDFDVYIDDRSDYILEAYLFLPDKIYVLPNYEQNKDTQWDDIFQIETSISSLKDEDFIKKNNELISQRTEAQQLEALTINPSNKLSLYELIKEQSKLKNRPLKIACDWDDCIQPSKPWVVFQASPDKDNLDKFDDYFQAYFNENTAKNEKAVEFTKKLKKEKSIGSHYDRLIDEHGHYWRYKTTPFTTIAEELLLAIKEGMVEDLIIISSFAYWHEGGERSSSVPRVLKMLKSKNKKILGSFGNWDGCSFEHTQIDKKDGKLLPYRWEVMQLLCPDFDMFIDDREKQITETAKNFPSDKIYVLPEYEDNKNAHGPNIYHVKTSISNIKDSDFIFDEKLTKKDKKNEQISQLQTDIQQLEIVDDKTSQQAQIEVSKQFAFLKK